LVIFKEGIKSSSVTIKETGNRLPDFWKEKLNKGRVKGGTSKMLEDVLEEKRRKIIKEWIDSGKIEAW